MNFIFKKKLKLNKTQKQSVYKLTNTAATQWISIIVTEFQYNAKEIFTGCTTNCTETKLCKSKIKPKRLINGNLFSKKNH